MLNVEEDNEIRKKKRWWTWVEPECAYFVQGPAIPENKVDGAFNVTFLEVMPPCVVTKSVLCPIKSTAWEVSLVAGYPKRRRLPPLHSW